MKPSELIRVNDIVASQKWDEYTFDVSKPSDPIKKVGYVLDLLSMCEKELFLTLLSKFVTIRDYRIPCSRLFRDLLSSFPETDHFVFSEITDKSDETKSSGAVNYEFKALSASFPQKKFEFKNDPRSPAFQGQNGLKIYVDDFIGSGDQFLGMIEKLESDELAIGDKIILTIVIQKVGADRLRKLGYTIISIHELDKSLESLENSDDFNLDPYELNSSITEKMPLNILMALGYAKSEAIVSMKRTPDNTLPIFSSKGEENKWPALFPR